MPFVVLGDPNYEMSIDIIKTLIDNKAAALELGFAFSDPIADGPIIQKADKRALDNGMTTKKAFDILSRIREYCSIPISLMLSFNLVYKHGIEEFYKKCKELKIDAVLCPDVPLEEAEELRCSREQGINQIFLISQITSDERIEKISKICSGYIYLVSLLGTTGIRDSISKTLPNLIKRSKRKIDLPVYVGFGISKPEHVKKAIDSGADGTICGSAICKIIEDNLGDFNRMRNNIADFCKSVVQVI
jgi:tryptophan synthase alpha chain